MQIIVTLRAGSGTDVYLRQDRSTSVDVFLRGASGSATDVYLRRDGFASTVESGGGGGFAYTQHQGLRVYYGGTVRELCLVASGDLPSSEAVLRIRKGSTTYCAYLVDTTDGDASHVRVQHDGVTKAIRLYT